MIVNFPIAPAQYNSTWMNQTIDSIKTYLTRAVSTSEATHRIILRSSNGTNYAVTVSDAGALVITAESGKTSTF
jgi:hypothetical protein